jgi:cullin 3
LFIDEKMCRGLSGASDEEVDEIVEKVMDIFRYVQEKDIFEKYYKQHLAKRLLLGRSVSDDAELNVIQRLKMECGFQFTTKVEGMFKDISKSATTMEAFRGYLRRNHSPLGGIELNVQVLTTGFWPTQAATECLLPDEVQQCCKVFEQFYLSAHNGRRLTWQTNMGTADLKVPFEKKRHELSVSTYQMVILMLYRGCSYRTFKELRELTGVSPLDLKRNLLMLAKYKILVKIPRTRRVDDTDKFHFNTRFRHKLYRVKVMSMLPTKNEAARTQTLKKIDEDRKHHIEAAIVRTMKARKALQHSLLLIEVTNQLKSRFTPHPGVVKKRIESLIERDYLERSKSDLKTYNYLA